MRTVVIGSILAAAGALGGCTLSQGIERSALDYNRVADTVQKELLLLNAARARRGEGLTYTGISEMRGSFTVDARAAADIPFGGDASSAYGLDPSVAYQTSPSVKIVPLGTRDFQRGIATDIDASILVLLWERGWPPEVLLHLLVEKVTIVEASDDRIGTGCPYVETGKWTPRPVVVRGNPRPVVHQERVFENGPDAETASGRSKLPVLQQVLLEAQPLPRLVGGLSERRVGKPYATLDRSSLEELKLIAQAHDPACTTVRTCAEAGVVVSGEDDCLQPLLAGWVGDGDVEVEVVFRGERYFVLAGREDHAVAPRYVAGRSLLAMALAQALFNMQTRREDLPSTQTVVTTGPTL